MNEINIAFCFDENLWMQAGVAITSLLYNTKNKCHYNVNCVVSNTVNQLIRKELENIVKKQDSQSSITFFEANHDFDQSYFGQYTVGMYYRLMLPNLLTHLDKIIYSDVDIIFCRDMIEIENFDLGDNLIAGMKDWANVSFLEKCKKRKYKLFNDKEYINSGFLIMNLKKLRQDNLYKYWIELSKNKSFTSPDQDILNYTCQSKKAFFPLKYNFASTLKKEIYDGCIKENIYSYEEYENAINDPTIIHYVGPKPWNQKVPLVEIWLKYAAMTPFYNVFILNQLIQNIKFEEKIYLFNFILLFKIKAIGPKRRYYLFGFIPLFKRRKFPCSK